MNVYEKQILHNFINLVKIKGIQVCIIGKKCLSGGSKTPGDLDN